MAFAIDTFIVSLFLPILLKNVNKSINIQDLAEIMTHSVFSQLKTALIFIETFQHDLLLDFLHLGEIHLHNQKVLVYSLFTAVH